MANDIYLDTDVIIRYLTGDDPVKQSNAADLFNQVEDRQISLEVVDSVIADAVFVLTSPRQYGMARDETSHVLSSFVSSPGIVMRDKRAVLEALNIFGATNLDFGDCMIVASMRQSQARQLYSYDRDFDRFQDIERVEP